MSKVTIETLIGQYVEQSEGSEACLCFFCGVWSQAMKSVKIRGQEICVCGRCELKLRYIIDARDATLEEIRHYKDKCEIFNKKTDEENNRKVTVCDKCLQASCWHGEHMCQQAQTAGITQKTVAELMVLGREHSDYWEEGYGL